MEVRKKAQGKSRSQRFKDSQRALGNKQLAVWATPGAMEEWDRIKKLSKDADNNRVLSNIARVLSTMDDMEIIDRLSRPAA